jgi:hypothetical protein
MSQYKLNQLPPVFASGFSETVPAGGAGGADYDNPLAGLLSSHIDDSDAEDDEGPDPGDQTDYDDEPQSALEPPPVTLANEPEEDTEEGRNVRPKLDHPSSPRTVECPPTIRLSAEEPSTKASPVPGPNKMTVVVRDASYWTYRAVLYWASYLPYIHTNYHKPDLTFIRPSALYRQYCLCASVLIVSFSKHEF